MKNDGLILLLGGAALLYIFSRSDSGESALTTVGDIVDHTVSGVRGIRNNNPGNIRLSGTQWQGLAPTQTDSSFFQFVTMDYGVRAIAKILLTYQNTYGLNTVADMISRWAPASENDTSAYIQNVADHIGVSSSDTIDVNDLSTMFSMVRAIISQENGLASYAVSDQTVNDGIAMAFNS